MWINRAIWRRASRWSERFGRVALVDMSTTPGIYAEIPGGSELVAWFGREPRFHDAEIVGLNLRRRAESTLDVHFWTATGEVDERGYFVLDNHVLVTFAMEEIVDLELDGFNHQNAIYGLSLRRSPIDPERAPYVMGDSPDDFEIEIEGAYGMEGRIRCQKISIRLTPGKPADSYPPTGRETVRDRGGTDA